MNPAATKLNKPDTVGSPPAAKPRRNRVTALAELVKIDIKTRLKQSRKQAGLSQREIGDALTPPAHWRTIQNWESLESNTVPFNRLDDWAQITGVTKHWLLHGDEEPAIPVTREEIVAELAAMRAHNARFEVLLTELQNRLEALRPDENKA